MQAFFATPGNPEKIKSVSSSHDSGPRVAEPAPVVAAGHRDLCRRGGLEHAVEGYQDGDICASGRDKRGIGSQEIRGRGRGW